MSDPKGFLKYKRDTPKHRPVKERVKDFKEIYQPFSEAHTQIQAKRCMDCGVPFCHSGCPLGNIIPDFNEAVSNEEWELAFEILSKTNNFPEFTGRICPAPCESACVLGINQDPVAIEHIEKTIAEEAFKKGWVRPKPPTLRSGKQVAVIGSGPAGLAAAAQLNKSGHQVTVFERNDRVGGLLRYGIPDFKLEKWVLERRIAIMEAEGIRFETNVNVGENVDPVQLQKKFDALLLCGGSTVPRDLKIPGRELEGVHFAMDYLEQNNRKVAGDHFEPADLFAVKGKNIVVIGGGDTGADCVGTSNRLGAKSVTQLELMIKPPNQRAGHTPWPLWPMQLRTSSSHDEGCNRKWAILTKAFLGNGSGKLSALQLVDVEWKSPANGGRPTFVEIPDSERLIPCDHCFLAIGFIHPQFTGLLEQLGVEVNDRGNVVDQNYHTSVDGVFVAGDMRRGQSLVVWAISEGREAARSVDRYLSGRTALESKAASVLSNYH
ncbi:MAG: glutamate synthase subunit beta [Bacteroidota bacterium]